MGSFLRRLRFSSNFNGKLHCRHFTTLRPYDKAKFTLNYVYRIELNGELLGTAQLIGIRKTRPSKLNEFVCRLDTGYGVSETQRMISKIYNTTDDIPLMFLMLRFLTQEPNASVKWKK